jgi:hypothetical protein
MPGIFHALFGCVIGLLAWKLAEGKNGEKRYSLALIFVFAFNNYIGPDLGGIFMSLGEALGSTALDALGQGIHSYFGFLLFALPYAVAWYAVLLGIEQSRIRNVNKLEPDGGKSVLHASYPKVLLMVVAGGIMHHFVDSIGHPYRYPVSGWYYPRGMFVLIPPMTPEFWLTYGTIIVIVAAIAVLYIVLGIYRRRFTFMEKARAAFTRETIYAAAFMGVVVLNVLMMYGIMAAGNLVKIDDHGINFMLGNMLHVASTIFEGEAEWWIAAAAAPTLVLFFLCHAKAWHLRIAGRPIRADLFVVLCFIASILIGYALQPVIGNISGTEADMGALIFTWSTIGTMLIAFIMARSNGVPYRAGTI